MFSDGIRPGGDLTELDGQPESRRSSRRSGSRGHKKSRSRQSGQNSGTGGSARGPVAASDVAKRLQNSSFLKQSFFLDDLSKFFTRTVFDFLKNFSSIFLLVQKFGWISFGPE